MNVLLDDTTSDPFRLVGTIFDGTYRIERVVGGGSFGVVYAATHQQLRRRVALKVLKLENVREPEVMIERFWREARSSAALKNAGAIEVHDARVERPGGRIYYSMDLLSGVSLQTRWMASPQRQMAPAEALGCIRQVASSMAVAHAAGIVHRDLKPENIFLCRDRSVRVLDFGCAHIKHEPRITAAGRVLGLPYYMPPEQLDFGRNTPDPRMDVYALGVTLYHILSGRFVYPAHHDPIVVVKHVLVGPPIDIGQVAPDLPVELHQVIRRAMARNPEDRFQTMAEFEAAIGKLLRSGAVPLRVGADASTLAKTLQRRSGQRTLLERLIGRRREEAPTIQGPTSEARSEALPETVPLLAPRTVQTAAPPSKAGSRLVWIAPLALACIAAAVLVALFARHRGQPVSADAPNTPLTSAAQGEDPVAVRAPQPEMASASPSAGRPSQQRPKVLHTGKVNRSASKASPSTTAPKDPNGLDDPFAN
jgi:serine/threonine protein kinase